MVGNLMDNILEITNDEWIDILDNLKNCYFEYKGTLYFIEENINDKNTLVDGIPASIVQNIFNSKYFAVQEKYNRTFDTYELYNVLEVFPETITVTIYNKKLN